MGCAGSKPTGPLDPNAPVPPPPQVPPSTSAWLRVGDRGLGSDGGSGPHLYAAIFTAFPPGGAGLSTRPLAVLMLATAHGTHVHSADLVSFVVGPLVEAGYAVIAFDKHGHGRTGLRNRNLGMTGSRSDHTLEHCRIVSYAKVSFQIRSHSDPTSPPSPTPVDPWTPPRFV